MQRTYMPEHMNAVNKLLIHVYANWKKSTKHFLSDVMRSLNLVFDQKQVPKFKSC